MARSLEQRRKNFRRLSSQVAAMDSSRLQGAASNSGEPLIWGRTELLKVVGSPGTELEFAL